jgi:hypothetical protein
VSNGAYGPHDPKASEPDTACNISRPGQKTTSKLLRIREVRFEASVMQSKEGQEGTDECLSENVRLCPRLRKHRHCTFNRDVREYR